MSAGVCHPARSRAPANRPVGRRSPEQQDRLPEQLGSEPSGSEDAVELGHERQEHLERSPELAVAHQPALVSCLTTKRGEPRQEPRPRCRWGGDHGTMPHENEQVGRPRSQTAAPRRQQLPADTSEASRRTEASVSDLLDCRQHARRRVDLARKRVEGQDPLPCPAAPTAREADPEPLVLAALAREPSRYPAVREHEIPAAAARAAGSIEDESVRVARIVRAPTKEGGVVGRMHGRHVNHGRLDGPTVRQD
jgi:hypothetical protein